MFTKTILPNVTDAFILHVSFFQNLPALWDINSIYELSFALITVFALKSSVIFPENQFIFFPLMSCIIVFGEK